MAKMKRSILYDYILYILYLIKDRGLQYVSLVSLVKSLKYEGSFSDIQEIGKYLDTIGWAKVIFSLGDVKVQITSRGLVYLEEKPDEFDANTRSALGTNFKKRYNKLSLFQLAILMP